MMIYNTEEKEAKKARVNAYQTLMQMPGWKDLEKWAENEKFLSMKRMDEKSASSLSLGEVCEERGIRKGIMKILNYAEQCREGI
jgi:hypothetical protein